MSHINGSGIQQHSDGGHLPYVVYMLGERIIVSLAGEPLVEVESWAAGHALALEFKRRNIRDSLTAVWIKAELANAVAHLVDHPALIADKARERNDHLMMYGDANHIPITGQEMLAWKRAEARKFEQAERDYETEQAYAKREADMAAAREEFYNTTEEQSNNEALNELRQRDLARRALGITQ